GRGEFAGVGAGALAGHPAGGDRGSDVGSITDLSGGDPDDGEAAQSEGAVALGESGLGETGRRRDGERFPALGCRNGTVRNEMVARPASCIVTLTTCLRIEISKPGSTRNAWPWNASRPRENFPSSNSSPSPTSCAV